MRFMILMIPGDRKFEEGVLPDEKAIAPMMKFNQELAKAGVLLALDGLQPTREGARIRFANGKRTVTDGPFSEAREIVGGYWLLQVKSKQEAIEWASRCPAAEGDVLEIRRVFEMSDFGAEIVHSEAERVDEIGKRLDENRNRSPS